MFLFHKILCGEYFLSKWPNIRKEVLYGVQQGPLKVGNTKFSRFFFPRVELKGDKQLGGGDGSFRPPPW